MAKLYNNQTFQISGAQWKYEQGSTPQGTMSATAKDGAQLAGIIPYDMNKPIDAPGNAVLFTKSPEDNQWRSQPPMDLKAAIKKGSNHIGNYHQDKQIAQVEQFFKNKDKQFNQQANAQSSRPSNDKQGKLPKFRNLEDLMKWQQRQKANGLSTFPGDYLPHNAKDRGMGD